MPVTINLQEIGNKLFRLGGELQAMELDLSQADELIHLNQPLHYDLAVEKTTDGLLAWGELRIILDCECARCLQPFQLPIHLKKWTCLLPWKGEDKVPVVHDHVDLTPYLREDIVLAFPQQPLCKTECQGIKQLAKDWQREAGQGKGNNPQTSQWSELDKLEF